MAPIRQSASTNQLRGRLDINSSKKSNHMMVGSGGLPISHQSPYAEPAQRDEGLAQMLSVSDNDHGPTQKLMFS